MKQKNFTDSAVRDEQAKRINEINDFISRQGTELTEFDESLARRGLKEIVVWDDRFSVELKLGVTVEIMVWVYNRVEEMAWPSKNRQWQKEAL